MNTHPLLLSSASCRDSLPPSFAIWMPWALLKTGCSLPGMRENFKGWLWHKLAEEQRTTTFTTLLSMAKNFFDLVFPERNQIKIVWGTTDCSNIKPSSSYSQLPRGEKDRVANITKVNSVTHIRAVPARCNSGNKHTRTIEGSRQLQTVCLPLSALSLLLYRDRGLSQPS